MERSFAKGFTVARSLLLAVAMLSTAAATEIMRPTLRLADLKQKIDLENQIPRSFGDWKIDPLLVPVLPNPEVQAKLDELYSSTLARTYVNSKGQRIMLSIAYGSDQGSEVTAVHRPEFCYSAQGFQVKNRGDVATDVGERKLMVRRLVGALNQRNEPITYWVTLDEVATLPGIGRKITQIKYGLKGQIPDGMLFRVSSIGRDEAAAFQLQEQFMREIAATMKPEIRTRYFGS